MLEVRAGDVVIHPAGVGHRRLSASKDLLTVGAYPKSCRYDEPRPGEIDYQKAVKNISQIGLPPSDPVYGAEGPLMTIWRKKSR